MANTENATTYSFNQLMALLRDKKVIIVEDNSIFAETAKNTPAFFNLHILQKGSEYQPTKILISRK